MPKVVKSSAREMILKVKEFCEAEQKNQGVLIPLNNVRKRVAAITGVSEKTVTRITKEGITAASSSKKIVTPGKSRLHPKKFDLDGFDLCAIRQKIHSFYVVKKELPTLGKLRAALKEDINFQGSITTLHRILNRIGFKAYDTSLSSARLKGESRFVKLLVLIIGERECTLAVPFDYTVYFSRLFSESESESECTLAAPIDGRGATFSTRVRSY
ncbi:hypothetical protein evm_012968 [Chilo suppressalis]|nr:hypothetical protein evm_012968 [Chilo suppressalis]